MLAQKAAAIYFFFYFPGHDMTLTYACLSIYLSIYIVCKSGLSISGIGQQIGSLRVGLLIVKSFPARHVSVCVCQCVNVCVCVVLAPEKVASFSFAHLQLINFVASLGQVKSEL